MNMIKVQRPEVRGNESDVVALIPALRAFARTFYRNRDDADDLVQETLTKAIGSIDGFQSGTRLKSWLFTIMRNAFYTRVKRAQREAPGDLDCVASVPTMAATQDWHIGNLELKAALERLPDGQREAIILVGALGVSYEEAASICQCEIGTIKSRINRARSALALDLDHQSSKAVFHVSGRT